MLRQMFSAYNLEFLFGIATARLVRAGRVWRPVGCMMTGATGFLAIGMLDSFGGTTRAFLPAYIVGYGLCSALLLYGVAVMAGSGRSFLPEWAVRLGTASYSIYLVHIIALILTQQALRRLRLVMDLPLEIA